jgi:hypothetical protein
LKRLKGLNGLRRLKGLRGIGWRLRGLDGLIEIERIEVIVIPEHRQ